MTEVKFIRVEDGAYLKKLVEGMDGALEPVLVWGRKGAKQYAPGDPALGHDLQYLKSEGWSEARVVKVFL